MAEVLAGVVASGITIGALGAQITSGILKIKSFWNQVQDAPRDIEGVLKELELYCRLLADADEDRRRNPASHLILSSNSGSMCLQYCKEYADELREITDGLAVDMEKNRLRKHRGSIKAVWNREKISRYKSKLERYSRLLFLSLQIY